MAQTITYPFASTLIAEDSLYHEAVLEALGEEIALYTDEDGYFDAEGFDLCVEPYFSREAEGRAEILAVYAEEATYWGFDCGEDDF